MKKLVGVRFRQIGKSYYYDPGELDLSIGTGVIVQGADGKEYGTVSVPTMEVEEEKLPAIIKQIVRVATDEDKVVEGENRIKEEEAFWICKEKISELSLPMKLIRAEYTYERNKLLFYFTAEGRVDFRELVRLLASVFRTRIELRQVGVRDEAKLLGGIGICGRELCCNTYLSGFAPVSIKMAKEQNLSLNPTKISGVCGRLMCCLAHEEEVYEYLNRTMPKNGDYATNVEGRTGTIRSVNILKQSVLVIFEDGDTREMKEYPVSEVGLKSRRQGPPTPEEVEKVQSELEESLRAKMEEEIARALENGDEGELSLLERKAEEMGIADVAKKHDKNRDRGNRRRDRRGRSDAEDFGERRTRNKRRDSDASRGKNSKVREDAAKKGRDAGKDSTRATSGGRNKNRRDDRGKDRNGSRRDRDARGKDSLQGKPDSKNKGSGKNARQDMKPSKREAGQAGKPGAQNADAGGKSFKENAGKEGKSGNKGFKKNPKQTEHRNGGYSRGYRTDRKKNE